MQRKTPIRKDWGVTVQCADVDNRLGCAAGLADGPAPGRENYGIFSSKGGAIVPEKAVTLVLPKDKEKATQFDRRGMVYVMAAWVDIADAAKSVGNHGSVFSGPVGK